MWTLVDASERRVTTTGSMMPRDIERGRTGDVNAVIASEHDATAAAK